ncbi:MAG: metal-dependent transcriptional regulator [Candidatus Lokiarchaeota archaeon]|nr:metal-dependent transcriptional regulator [Candidatus Lokiarchaeota archaeon]
MSKEKEIQISDFPESYQMYLKRIYQVSRKKRGGWATNKEVAESLEVEPPSISEMLHKLKKRNLINWTPRKAIRLTKKGKQIANQLIEIEALLNDFFGKVLKIDDKPLVEKISCEIEHHITREVKEAFKKFLSSYLT